MAVVVGNKTGRRVCVVLETLALIGDDVQRVFCAHMLHAERNAVFLDRYVPARTPAPTVDEDFIVGSGSAIHVGIVRHFVLVFIFSTINPAAVDNHLVKVIYAELVVEIVADALVRVVGIGSRH